MIFEYLKFYEKHRQREANVSSMTEAKGWACILNSFSGKGGQKIKAVDFLPFPSAFEEDKPKPFKPSTAQLIARLIKAEKVPMRVSAILQSVEQIQDIVSPKSTF